MERKISLPDSLEANVLAFLGEIRDEVCSRCGGRPVGEKGEFCDRELPLEWLLEVLQGVAASPTPAEPSTVCPRCVCPLSRERIAELAVAAAEDLERRRQQRERLLQGWEDN
jgi:hypothetical protein